MTKLGVEIGLAKSIISPSGSALEFAKRTIFNGQDVSPVPLKEYSASLETSAAFMQFCSKYQAGTSFVRSCLGMGYRSSTQNMRWRIWTLLLSVPHVWTDLQRLFLELVSDLDPYNLPKGMSWKEKFHLMDVSAQRMDLLIQLLRNKAEDLYKRYNNFWVKTIQTLTDKQMSFKDWGVFWPNHKKIRAQELFETLVEPTARRQIQESWNIRGYLKGLKDRLSRMTILDPYGDDQPESWEKTVGRIAIVERQDFGKNNLSEWVRRKSHSYSIVRLKDLNLILSQLFDFEDQLNQFTAKNILSPGHESNLSPKEKDRISQMAKWNTWSNVVLQTHKISGFPITWNLIMDMFTRLFLISKTVNQGMTARSLMAKSLRLSAAAASSRLGYRSLVWIWLAESLLSISFVSLLWILIGSLVILLDWFNSDQTLSALPLLLLQPWIPLKESLAGMFEVIPQGATYYSLLFSYSCRLYLIIVGNSIYINLSEISSVIVNVAPWEWNSISYLLGVPFGIFYKFGIDPLVQIVKLPFLIGGDLTFFELISKNVWFDSFMSTFDAIKASLLSDMNFIQYHRSHLIWDETIGVWEIDSNQEIKYDSPWEDGNEVDSPTSQGSNSTVKRNTEEFSKYFADKGLVESTQYNRDDEWTVVENVKQEPKSWSWITYSLLLRHSLAFSLVAAYTITKTGMMILA